MTSLRRAYETSSQAVNSTGAAPSNFMYMEQMEEIFGTRPIAASKHSLNLFGEPITANCAKQENIAFSLRKAKRMKERLFEQKNDWKREKYDNQEKLQTTMLAVIEGSKRKRHEETKDLMAQYMEKKLKTLL